MDTKDFKPILEEIKIELYHRGADVSQTSEFINKPEDYPPYNYLFVKKFDSLLVFINMKNIINGDFAKISFITPKMIELLRVAQRRYKYDKIGVVLAAALDSDVIASVWWKFNNESEFLKILKKLHKTRRILASASNSGTIKTTIGNISIDMEHDYRIFQQVARDWLKKNMNFFYSQLEKLSWDFEVFPYDAYFVNITGKSPTVVSFMTLTPFHYVIG